MTDTLYNLIGLLLMLIGFYLWLSLDWPAPAVDDDPGFGEDEYVVRWDEQTGEAVWGERGVE